MTSAPASGQPLTRVDARLKVTGAATYTADHQMPELLYATLVGSTVALGVVVGIDVSAARRQAGVVEVITDFSGVALPHASPQISYFGQPLAVVVATSSEIAAHAASLVTVRYGSPSVPVTNIEASQAVRMPSSTIADYSRGEADAALAAAPVTSDLIYSIARHQHNPMELPATVARWDGDRLTVWDKVQGVASAVGAYSEAFELAEDDVRVISPFVGGAFGQAGLVWPHQLLTALAARQLGRPVKLILTRRQLSMQVGYRPVSRQRLAIGADTAGRIAAIVHDGKVETSRDVSYEDDITPPPRFMYRSPHMRSTYRVVPLDVSPPTWVRGVGKVTSGFALECGIDDLAHQLGVDPVELRIRNEPDRDPSTDLPFSTRRQVECLRRGADAVGWARRNPTPRTTRDGDQLIGLGMASAVYHSISSPCSVSARINADGTADVVTASSEIGAGTYTSMTQVAADALALPVARVRFDLGDSNFPDAPMHGAQQTMASVGSGVAHAGALLRDRFIRTAVVDPASPLHGARAGDIRVENGRMSRTDQPDRGETYQELLRRRGWTHLESEHTWTPNDRIEDYSIWSYGAVFAEVAVDELLGTVRIRHLDAYYDAGRIINPKLAHSQALGGMVWGIGMALLEHSHIDHRDGRVVNANLSDYLVPVNADIPALNATFLPAEDAIANPIGVKGLGELVMIGVAPAIANAVFNATGRRITELPITPESLM
ncbi:xanthine dehydrogenase family protein molybdopterin-binding subunit [soil metagenome]